LVATCGRAHDYISRHFLGNSKYGGEFKRYGRMLQSFTASESVFQNDRLHRLVGNIFYCRPQSSFLYDLDSKSKWSTHGFGRTVIGQNRGDYTDSAGKMTFELKLRF
jgi:hypothetical protein